MSRTKEITQPPADMLVILPAKAAELAALQDAAPSKDQMDAVLAAGIDLGRIEALDFVSTIVNSAVLPIYENVKKSINIVCSQKKLDFSNRRVTISSC